MGENESNSKASNDPSSVLDEESVALSSLPSGGTLKEYPESGPSSSTHHEPLKEERIEVGFDRVGAPITEAIESGDPAKLSNLLTTYLTEVNTIDSTGNAALHHAVASACQKDDWDESLCNCIDVLMRCEQMDLNKPNKKGYTAIGYALNELHKTCVEYMLKHPVANRLYLDYYPADSQYTVREIILETYPDLEPHLPPSLMESLDSSERKIKSLAALQRGEFLDFCANLDPDNHNPVYGEPYHSSLLEIACQMKNRQRFVKLLLDSGADPNIRNRVTGMPLLHSTARSGNVEVLLILLKNLETDISLKDNEQRTILHWLAGVSERNPGDKQKILYCLKFLLRSNNIWKKGIDDRDSLGNTALCTAVERGFQQRAKLLLKEGADVMVLEQGSKTLLSASLPILEEILDDCLLSNGKPLTNMDLLLGFENSFLMHIVSRIVESEHLKVLLRHPVISTYLTLKWHYIKGIFFIDMAVYFIFLCMLTAYILYRESQITLNADRVASYTTGPLGFSEGNVTSGMNDSKVISHRNNSAPDSLWHSLCLLWSFLVGRELFQLIMLRKAYLLSPEKWLLILFFVVSFISIFDVMDSTEIILQSYALALLLGWSELLLVSGRLQQMSLMLEMLKTVSSTFFNYMAGYIILLIAFALSFYILFRGSTKMFSNPLLSLPKIVIMLTGDFDTSSLSFETLPYTSYVIFLLFVVLMAIILLNLLNGLAVSDTYEIRKNAKTLSLVARARLISRIEEFAGFYPKWMLPSELLTTKELSTFYPNRPNSIGSNQLRSLLSIMRKKRHANKKWESPVAEDTWSVFTEKFSALELRQEKLERTMDEARQILMQILNRLDTAK